MLIVDSLSVNFSNPVLENLSFSIKAGEVVSIIGKSGSGKTTLLNSICEKSTPVIIKPDTVSLVTQENLLLDWRTTLENVLLPLELSNNISKQSISKAREYLEVVKLGDSVYKFPKELSGGMKQRTALARALLQDSSLYLFDEPFSAIDFDLRVYLIKYIREFITQNDKSALLVTHNIEEAISISDRILVLGDRPARIIYQEAVNIKDSSRDPVSVRANPDFPRLFSNLWKELNK